MSLREALDQLSYPCPYPFKLICQPDAVDAVRASILDTLGSTAVITDTHQRASSTGKYIALTLTVHATDADQIEQVYSALKSVTGIVTSL